MIAITPIPAFSDNYLWLLDNGSDAIVVDPGDARVVDNYLTQKGLNLVAILVTHHHADHIGGVSQLKNRYNARVFGPANEPISQLDIRCREGDLVEIPELGLSFSVIDVPGHTAGHIAYFAAASTNNNNVLFCGDTLFSGGCGRLFEGTASQMWHSIQRLMDLPDDTLIHPAHEYTLSNLKFAEAVEPSNASLATYKKRVLKWRESGKPSLPALMATEKDINPFMRIKRTSVIEAAERRMAQTQMSEADVFGAIRHWKDTF